MDPPSRVNKRARHDTCPHAAAQVQVLAINPGTQAEHHRELRAGLVLLSVGGASVKGRVYADVLDTIKGFGRPIRLQVTAEVRCSPAACPSCAVF